MQIEENTLLLCAAGCVCVSAMEYARGSRVWMVLILIAGVTLGVWGWS
jgi:hypothetical protein